MTAPAPVFVGRVAELRAVRAAVAAAQEGRPGVAVVLGPAGIGKSALLAQLGAAADAAGGVVLTASGDELEISLANGIVDQLVADRAPESRAAAEAGEDALEAGRRVLAHFDALGDAALVAVLVDDAHLADSTSLEALTFAARRLGADRVVIGVAARTAERLPAGLLRLAERHGAVIELGALDDVAVTELAAQLYARSVPRAVGARLAAHTGGSPLNLRVLMEELPYDVVARPGELPAPKSLATIVLGRLAVAGEPARRAAEAMAVLGPGARLVDVGVVAGVADVTAAADELAGKGLAAIDHSSAVNRISFEHGLVAACVYDDMTLARRRALHVAAATVVSPDAAVRHLLRSATGPDVVLADLADDLARREAARGARAHSAQLFLQAADVSATPGDRRRRILAAAEQLHLAGQPLGWLADEIERFPASAERDLALGRMVMAGGRFDAAGPILERAWQQAESAEVAGAAAELLAIVAIGTLRADDVLQWSRRALDAGIDHLSAMLVCHGLALAGLLDEAREEMSLRLQRPLSARAATDARLARAIAELWSNDLDGALADLDVATRDGNEAGFLPYANANAYQAEALLRVGRPVEALAVAEACLAVIDDAEMPWLAPLPLGTAAFALAVLGRTDEARERIAAADAIADATGQVPARIWVAHARLRVAVDEQDHAAVAAIGDGMLAAGWGSIPEGVHHWRAAYVDALIAVGRVDEVGEVVDDLGRHQADVSVATDAHRAAAAWRMAIGDDPRPSFLAGLALDATQARPFERARLELAAGQWHRRAGARTEAARLLRVAGERFARLGATTWTARAERELAACGLTPARRTGGSVAAALTAQEQVVARLVAAGHSNREVATELIISVKTVEHHLSRVYDKLGVRSRSRLAAAWRERQLHDG